MSYEKPEVFLARSALQTIQGSTAKLSLFVDGNRVDFTESSAAYDADD